MDLTRDSAIWIVERHYRPVSLAQVRRLSPDSQQAVIGYLLYGQYENERQWLNEDENATLKVLFEQWINWV